MPVTRKAPRRDRTHIANSDTLIRIFAPDGWLNVWKDWKVGPGRIDEYKPPCLGVIQSFDTAIAQSADTLANWRPK